MATASNKSKKNAGSSELQSHLSDQGVWVDAKQGYVGISCKALTIMALTAITVVIVIAILLYLGVDFSPIVHLITALSK